MENNFEKSFSSYQKELNKEIKVFFDNKIKNTKEKFLRSCLLSLKEYSLRPAKRIRAVLVNQGYLLAGGKEREKILKISIFIELIHNFLLIHDDVIDMDKKRRGKPTMQYKYGGGHYGDSMAIIMGDLINSLGYELLNSSSFSADLKNKAIDKLNKTIYLTGYGQALELYLFKNKNFSKKDMFEVYKNKTANYTFIAPLQIGAILAGANKLLLKEIESFAMPLGIAFQIKDDMLDIKLDKKSLIDKNYQKIAKELVDKSKKIILKGKFPKEQKEFLFNLADFIIERND